MADKDLQDLVQRRLTELCIPVEEASRRSGWLVGPETIDRLSRSGGTGFISEQLARGLAQALDVPENRVRRAAGLPEIEDPRVNISTKPHLRLVRDKE
jgi:hypothetical protein